MIRWIRHIFRSTPTAPIVKTHRTRLGVQRLEERETPATFNVTSTADSGAGSLRDAVSQANANPGADTITFQAGLGVVTLTSAGLSLTDTSGATTISGPSASGSVQGVRRSGAGGTPNFGIFSIGSSVTVNLNNLSIFNGRGVEGGGIFNLGNLTITNCEVSQNTSTGFGGGVYQFTGATLSIIGSTISGNSAGTNAGGVHNNGGVATISNSTISENTANGSGGGVRASGTTTLTNVTITGNRSDNDNGGGETGGGLGILGGVTMTLNNTLIAGNFRGTGSTRDDVSGPVAGTSSNNLIGDGTGLTGITQGSQGNQIGTGASPIDPKFGARGTYGTITFVYPLLAGSPAMNAGSNAAANAAILTTDGRGAPFVRISGGTVDIGAFEVQSIALVVDNTGDVVDYNYGAGQLTLREAVEISEGNPGADTITFAPGLGPVVLTSAQLTVMGQRGGAMTISGPSGGTQVVTRSTAGGTPDFGIFSIGTGATANLNNLTISNGRGVEGGGIFNLGTLTLTNSTVSGNSSSGFGGGVYGWETGTMVIIGSTISGNSAGTFAGGLHNNGGFATVINSTISGNTANVSSGGVEASGSTTLRNVTITGNRSDNDNSGGETGGGLTVFSGTTTLNNTLIAGNFRGSTGTTRDDVSGAVVGTNNLIGDGTNLTGITNGNGGNLIGTGAAPIDPLLLPLANNGGGTRTHALGQNSPALGKGSASFADYSVFDQRGSARDAAGGASPDIGAYEVNHPLAPVGVPTTLGGLFQPKPSASANEAFVKGLYQSTLLRAPDAAGLAGWVAQLNGGTSRSTVANGFVNSIENRRNQVTFFYRYFLNREPDTAGLNGWVDILRGGADEGNVMTGFILSNEFSGQNNNSQFVNLMYYALLSRQADTAGFNGWVNTLNAGQSRGVVVNAFLRSEEGLNRVIDSLFQSYLKRYGTAGDLGAYRTFLNTNTFGQAATLILSSAEFFTNAGNNLS